MSNQYHNLAQEAFKQDWTNISLINTNNDWSSVASIIGYRGDNLNSSNNTDPQTIISDGTNTPLSINANQNNPNIFSGSGITEFELSNPVVALNTSNLTDSPFLLLHLNTLDTNKISVSYTLKNLDQSVAQTTESVALQYRIGNSGDFINVPTAFVTDTTITSDININAILPRAAENQSEVQVRIISTSTTPIGIDDIHVSAKVPEYRIGDFGWDTENIITDGSIINPTQGVLGFSSGFLGSSNTPLADKTVGAILNIQGDGKSKNNSVVLGEEPALDIIDNRAQIELTWGGSRLANEVGDDLVIYENGNTNFYEGYAVAVRRVSDGEFTSFLYQFSDSFDDSAVNGINDDAGVFATGFDLSDFGLSFGEQIDAIRIVNLIEADKVSGADGQGFVDLTGITGYTPLSEVGGSAFTRFNLDPDITMVAGLHNLQKPTTKIHDIQGSDTTFNSDFGGVRTIEGIIVNNPLGSNQLDGFYVQEENADFDDDPHTSERIFVYNPSEFFFGNIGDKVRVTGTVGESHTIRDINGDTTQIKDLSSVIVLNDNYVPVATDIPLPYYNSELPLESSLDETDSFWM
ncbi:hypothetical protein VB711_13320 [Cronbergia sp. UHCC 0137]|uniref:hypothetical protein n=1 Tax=Cronbergia sp. UHCC 0137 TaxID=3110239 RepID=UPI002B1F9ADA|nr:hypothetical protein [Cronbergia sp. UHCC 0137]MEA5618811.1 hypothetical protein [Cronbergia sp. UHCC 0137]